MDVPLEGRCAPDGIPPLRVLCVDDNRDIADSEVDLLQILGFEMRACYDGPSALAEAVQFRPSVCLIDLNMPGMDGDELTIQLRAQAIDMPLILVAVTAMSDDRSRQRIRDAGFDLHLMKPVDPHKLLAVVDELWRVWDQVAANSQLIARALSHFSQVR